VNINMHITWRVSKLYISKIYFVFVILVIEIPSMKDKPSQVSLGRISRRVNPKGMHLLFTDLGLNPNVIQRKDFENRKLVMLVLLLEWARTSKSPTYRELGEALYREQEYTLQLKQVICFIKRVYTLH